MTSTASPSPLDELRAAVAGLPAAPAAMSAYLAKVRDCAYALTDDDVEQLKGSGFTEDEIFEQTVAAAVGEGLRRLEAAERAFG